MAYILSVDHGPFHTSTIPDWVDDPGYVLVCRVWDGTAVRDEEIVFDDLDEAYEVIHHFLEQGNPYYMEEEI